MRRVFEPVIPTISVAAVVLAILALAEPVVKFAVESLFTLAGY